MTPDEQARAPATMRQGYFADRGIPGHWFVLCSSCPMHAEKMRESDSPVRIACMGGTVAGERDLNVVNFCWHTASDGLSIKDHAPTIACNYDPRMDAWNHPGGKAGAPKAPQTLVSTRADGESMGEVAQRMQSGALSGTLRLPDGFVLLIQRGE